MTFRPRLAVTLGDPRGIGPEITAAALATPLDAEIIVIGAEDQITAVPAGRRVAVGSWGEGSGEDLPATKPGPSRAVRAGRITGAGIEMAVKLALAGDADAIVTAPAHKHALHLAGFPWPGHTEWLAHLAGDVEVAMMLAADALRVVLVTTHVPFRAVPALLTTDTIIRTGRVTRTALQRWWGIAEPRLAVCALNPHAGESGLFGDEEERVMRPAVEALGAIGPLPADTVFVRAMRGEFDAVLAPYHDVGMTAIKVAAFGRAVNVTLGLPFPRTSPDHGTAFDIAGKGRADPASMRARARTGRRSRPPESRVDPVSEAAGAPWAVRAQWLAVALGGLLRLRQYLHARPLWIDEAMLANNILGRSFLALLAPLDSDQSAPIPFLWLVKLGTRLGGADERVLRALPLVAGLLLLPIFLAVARRLLAPWTAAWALFAVALSPLLIYYSNEVKPYSLDAFGAVLALLLTLRIAEAPERSSRWAALLAIGIVVSVASAAAPMVLAGAGLGLVLDAGVRGARGAWGRMIALALLWGGVFAVAYLTVYRATADSAYLQRYWVPLFLSPALPALGAKIYHAAGDLVVEGLLARGGLWRWDAGLILYLPMLVGAWVLARRSGARALALVAGPAVIAVGLSIFQRYPVAPRLMLFALPSGVLLLAAGLEALVMAFPGRWGAPAGLLLGVLLLGLPARDAGLEFRTPGEREAMRSLVHTFLAEHHHGAPVYLYGRAVPNWVFYTTDWARPDTTRVRMYSELVGSTGRAFRHAASRGRAVRNEGNELVFGYRDWIELVGVPTGTGPDSLGINGVVPDTGWANNEARRIRSVGSPEAWVVLSSFLPGVPESLDSALAAVGGTRTLELEEPGALLQRYKFR